MANQDEVRSRLSVSVVGYGGDAAQLAATLASLHRTALELDTRPGAVVLKLVDNGPPGQQRAAQLDALGERWGSAFERLAGHGNIGYGRGHNLAILACDAPYHLVLNPDVELAPDTLRQALAFLEAHPECGLLAPAVRNADGELQYLCKRRPAVLDLVLRGLAPQWLRTRFHRRLAHYEMRDRINDRDLLWDPPIVSGCFMLFRASVLKAVGGFDPRYFLYFEDFDLSLRTGRVARIAYVPWVRVVHHGGGAARKGLAHRRMFVASAVKFFRQHGWRWV